MLRVCCGPLCFGSGAAVTRLTRVKSQPLLYYRNAMYRRALPHSH